MPLSVKKEARWRDLVTCVLELVALGCQHKALWVSLHLAQTVKNALEIQVIPSRKAIRSLSKKMKALADEIAFLEAFSSRFLVVQEREAETNLGVLELILRARGWNPRFMTPYSELPFWLRQRAAMYDGFCDSFAAYARKNTSFARLTHLYAALYVLHATKQTHFPRVRQLLNLAELATGEMSESQLSRELGEFRRKYPEATDEIMSRFALIEAGDLEYFCNGFIIL
jgi:hypothetical protein